MRRPACTVSPCRSQRRAAEVHAGFCAAKITVRDASLDGLTLKLRKHHQDLRHDRAGQAVVERDPVGARLELDPMVGQGLAQAGEIVYAAADAVEAVGEDFSTRPAFTSASSRWKAGRSVFLPEKPLSV